jgi:hypothetical protein
MRVVISSVMGYVLFGRALCAGEAQFLERTLSIASQALGGTIPTLINAAIATVLQLLRCPERQSFVLSRRQRRAVRQLTCWIAEKIEGARLAGLPTPLLDSLQSRFADLRIGGATALRRRRVCDDVDRRHRDHGSRIDLRDCRDRQQCISCATK